MRASWLLLFACWFVALAVRDDDTFDPEPLVALFELVAEDIDNPESARQCLSVLAEKIQSRELAGEQLATLRNRLQPALATIQDKSDHPLLIDAALLSASWKDSNGVAAARVIFSSATSNEDQRLKALGALIAAGDKSILQTVSASLVENRDNSARFRAAVLAALGRSDSSQVASIVLASYAKLEPELQPRAIELLTQRPAWAKMLLAAIRRREIPATAINRNQAARLLKSRDEELVKLMTTTWGTVRTERNPDREQVITKVREMIRSTPGDPFRGEKVFKTICAQCHKIHGEGQEVGPDLTSNGRGSFEQLLSSVLDPSLVIGGAYQARVVDTEDGRSITGLLFEDGQDRIVLKLQGGKLETIPRDQVADVITSQLSMMPEDLDKQLKPQEIVDLFAFLAIDKHPSDPAAKRLPDIRE
jgi:putative heme-binding domain-containing protein